MICQNCGYDDNGTGDFAHACKPLNLSDPTVQKRLAAQWGYVQKPHPDCDEGCMFQCAQPAPSVPDGYLAGIKASAAMLQKKADDYANEHGYDDMGGLSFGSGMNGEIKMDYYTTLLELVDEVKSMLAAAPESKP